MKRLLYMLLAAFVATACGERSEVYYSTTYPVTEIRVSVSFDSEKSTKLTVETIEEDVRLLAPVAVGGSYRLDFSLYNGGLLYVTPAVGAEVIAGSFTKVPASKQLEFMFDAEHYTATTTTYTTSEGERCVCLNVDLSEFYRARYQDDAIKQVVRHEYTSHIAD